MLSHQRTVLQRQNRKHLIKLPVSGNWETQFDISSTSRKPFFRLDGEKQYVSLMFTDGDFLIADLPDLDARGLLFPFRGCK